MSRRPGAASCVDISVGSVATPGNFAWTGSQDEDAIARAASLERAEPAPGSQMLEDGDYDDDDDEYEK